MTRTAKADMLLTEKLFLHPIKLRKPLFKLRFRPVMLPVCMIGRSFVDG